MPRLVRLCIGCSLDRTRSGEHARLAAGQLAALLGVYSELCLNTRKE